MKRPRDEGERIGASSRKWILSETAPLVVLRPGESGIRKSQCRDYSAPTFSKDTGENPEESDDPPKMEEGNERNEKEATGDLTHLNSLRYLKNQSRLVAQENEAINAKRRKFLQKHADLLGVYTYGLEQISKLTTLTDAPDAILPGNFC